MPSETLSKESLITLIAKEAQDVPDLNPGDFFHVDHPPSDTHLRRRLDQVDPEHLRKFFTKIFSAVQRTNGLKNFKAPIGKRSAAFYGTISLPLGVVYTEDFS